MLGRPSVLCWLLWFLCCCSMFFPCLSCFMCWGFWDYFDAKVICWCLVWMRVGFVMKLLPLIFIWCLIFSSCLSLCMFLLHMYKLVLMFLSFCHLILSFSFHSILLYIALFLLCVAPCISCYFLIILYVSYITFMFVIVSDWNALHLEHCFFSHSTSISLRGYILKQFSGAFSHTLLPFLDSD